MQTHGGGNSRKQQFRERLGVLRETAVKRHLPEGRWTRRHWIHASLFTTIGVLMATIVPGFSSAIQAPVSQPRNTLLLELPELSAARQAGTAGDSWQVVRVKPGQTMGAIFEELGIPAATLHRILENSDAKKALTRLKPGTEIAFDLPVTGSLRTLRYDRDPSHRVELLVGADKITERVIARETTTRTVVLSGKVGRSLNRSARKAGLTSANINSMTDEIFKYDIDFNSDLGPDDRFSVVVEQTWREGELISTGPVQAATFTVYGKLYSGFRFSRPGGKPEYFTAAGRPLKKNFIRMPIAYARMSSKFGARRHPVLGTMRMHKVVDYAASTGTPIMAAGDGRVQFAGWQGGYGRTVILDHGRGHTTLYAHMSRFGKYKAGQRVRQGETIGYVGSSGLSTGPHLHYEFRVNGVHRNPLSVTMPPPEPLKGADLVAFRAQMAPALAQLQRIDNARLAKAEPAPQAEPAKPERPKA